MIKSFSGDYEFLSNFYTEPCLPERLWSYPTVEHFFQAMKTKDKAIRIQIGSAPTPGKAKRIGREIYLRNDWEEIKLDVMDTGLRRKFKPGSSLAQRLVDTYPLNLIEGNNWHDNFWGDCSCQGCSNIIGRNHLGMNLMKIRASLMIPSNIYPVDNLPIFCEKFLTQEMIDQIISLLEPHRQDLKPDVSSYAQGRLRAWLPRAWNLRDKCWDDSEVTIHDEPLWNLIKAIVPEADVGLVTYGPVGIHWHRDDTYADWQAWSIQLGRCGAWGYDPQYSGWQYGEQANPNPMLFHVVPGQVIKFNPKNRHCVLHAAEDRWTINLWAVKDKFKPII